MSIKIANAISGIVPDGSNPQELMNFLTSVKLAVEELANKAKSIQTEIHTVNEPNIIDFTVEGEEIRSDIGGTRKVHTLLNGSKRSVTVT